MFIVMIEPRSVRFIQVHEFYYSLQVCGIVYLSVKMCAPNFCPKLYLKKIPKKRITKKCVLHCFYSERHLRESGECQFIFGRNAALVGV
jgi:hypothetical protein